jgi:hypothetical protein
MRSERFPYEYFEEGSVAYDVPQKGGNDFLINASTYNMRETNIFRRKEETYLTKNVAGASG